MARLVAVLALGIALAAPATAQAWGVDGDTGIVTAFAIIQVHDTTGGQMFTTLAYTKDVADCPNGEVSPYSTQNVDGFVYLEDTGGSLGDDGFDHVPALGDFVVETQVPYTPYPDRTFVCLAMTGTIPTVDINGISIIEDGGMVLANTAFQANVVVRKSVTLRMKDAGAHYLHNTVRLYDAAGKLVASGKHLGLGIHLSASLVRGHSYKVVFRASGYTHTKTIIRKVTVR